MYPGKPGHFLNLKLYISEECYIINFFESYVNLKKIKNGPYWVRTSDPYLVEVVLSQLS